MTEEVVVDLQNAEWVKFKADFNRTYDGVEEETKRFKIFAETKKKVDEHNALYEKGEVTYTMGINNFADKLPEELKMYTGCCRPSKE